MDKYKETILEITELSVDTIMEISDTKISDGAFMNACENIDTYRDRQIEKCGWFKTSPTCLLKVLEITRETLNTIVVRSAEIKDEDELQKTVRELSRTFKVVDLEK